MTFIVNAVVKLACATPVYMVLLNV